MEESESTYVDGDVDKFIEQLEQGLFEQQWIRDRLAVIKQNEEYRTGEGRTVVLDASET